ncbi:MAG: hypothetical protein JWL70_2916 [Acidimicrobiia bacterium]|nr:hypothetical protein [Acidimicrobiia bacterium]
MVIAPALSPVFPIFIASKGRAYVGLNKSKVSE